MKREQIKKPVKKDREEVEYPPVRRNKRETDQLRKKILDELDELDEMINGD